MAFSSEQIASLAASVTSEHLRPVNNSDDENSQDVTVSSGDSYQTHPVSTPSLRLSTFHDSLHEGDTTQERIISATQELSIRERNDSQTGQPIHRQSTSASSFNLEQAEKITCPPLSTRLCPRIDYKFKPIKALFHAQKYLAITEQLGKIDTTTFNECTLDHYDYIAALSYFKLVSYTKAKQHFKDIINRVRGNDISSLSARNGSLMEANYYLGHIFLADEDFDSAADYFQSAIDCYPKSQPVICNTFRTVPVSANKIYNSLSVCKKSKNNLQGAIESYKLGIIAATTSKEKIKSLISIGNLVQCHGLYQEAVDYYLVGIKITTQICDIIYLRTCYGNIANAYLGLQQPEKAIEYFKKELALNLPPKSNATNGLSRIFNNIGTAYQAMNDNEKASTYYSLALMQTQTLTDLDAKARAQARALGNIANLYAASNRHKEAQSNYREVIRISRGAAEKNNATQNLAYSLYADASNQLEELLNLRQSIMFIQYSDLAINLDPQFHLLKNSHEVTEVEKLKDLILIAIEHFEQSINYKLSHIPNTIDRYENKLFKPALNQCVKTFARHQDCLLLLGMYEQALAVAVYARETCILTECQATRVNSPDHFDTATFPLTYNQIVKAITASNRPTSILSFTGKRLSIWYCHQAPDVNPMTVYVFPSNKDHLNESMVKFLKNILHSPNGTTRFIKQSFTSNDRDLMKALSITNEQVNTLIENLEPFISKINSVLPSEEEKESILWLT